VTDKQDFLVLVTSAGLGQGEPDLGEKLLTSFLKILLDSSQFPDRMIFINSGIFLTTAGSPLFDIIKQFELRGAGILSCSTCLDYYGRTDKLIVGRPTNMRETVNALISFRKVITI